MKNKNFRITIIDILYVVLLCLIVISSILIFNSSYDYTNYKNISNTKVDYIITLPNRQQVEEIKELDSTEKIVPYYYFKADSSKGKECPLFVIDTFENIEYTVFSEELLISEKHVESGYQIYIDEVAASNYKLKIGDSITLSFADSTFDFVVSRIYMTDGRSLDGAFVCECSNEIKSTLNQYYDGKEKFKGAYICSNNVASTKQYLETYVGLSNLKTEDEFSSKQEYEDYLETYKPTAPSKDTIDIQKLVSEKELMYKEIVERYSLYIILVLVLGIVISTAYLFFKKIKYISKNLLIDIQDNYSSKQEKMMFIKYDLIITLMLFAIILLLYILEALNISYILTHYLNKNYIIWFILANCLIVAMSNIITTISINKAYAMKE